jgi:hypothetical protein
MHALRSVSKLALAGVGAGAAAYLFSKYRSAHPHGGPERTVRANPMIPIEDVDRLSLDELGLDAQSAAEVAADLELARVEVAIEEALEEPAGDLADIEAAAHDVGDLYGVHTPPAADREHPDGDVSFERGENWIEALEASAVENGAEPERELDVVDDEDLATAHKTDTRDTPVADRGSGGPAGI